MLALPRPRRDPAKESHWRRVVRLQKKSGLSVRDFCEKEGLKECTLQWWRRELARRDQEVANSHPATPACHPGTPAVAPGFLPVCIVEADDTHPRPVPCIEIVMRGGSTVRVPVGFDLPTLGDVLAVLEGRSC